MNWKGISWVGLILLLAACSAGAGSPPTAAPSARPAATSTASIADPPRVSPSPTAQPIAGQSRIILVAPPELSSQADAARAALVAPAAAAKLGLEVRPALRAEEIRPEAKVLVFLQAPPDLPALLAAAPQSMFVVVAGADLQARGNLSVIRQREELRAFLGGYIATLAAPDWRSAGLLPDAPANLQEAFLNGGRYWCGRCIPTNGPVVLFPLAAVQPAGATPAAWQGALANLQKSVVQSVYLSPEAYSPELAKTLAAQKLVLVGARAPADELKPRWAATLRFDPLPALVKLLPGLAAGQGGQTADSSLSWGDVNESLFTPGKQRLAQQTLAGLLDGSIGVFSVK